MTNEPSRLLSGNITYNGQNIPIEEYRKMMSARSLYSLSNEYENTNMYSLNNKGDVASSISTVLNVIPQYNRMQVNTNLIGNTYDAFRDGGSPLAKIGLVMLGKQIAYNSAANLATKYIPSINLSNALKGGKVFNNNVDNTISVKNDEDKSFGDKLSGFGSKFLGIETYDVFGNANPFINGFGYEKAIKNTGSAQLTHLYQAINKNKYKSTNKTFVEYSDEVGVTIDSKRKSLLVDYKTFTFDNANFHPYLGIKVDPISIDVANAVMNSSYSRNTESVQEYAPTLDYVKENFGDTVGKKTSDIDNYVGDTSNFSTTENEKLVWGRDGVNLRAAEHIKNLRGDDDIDNTGDDNYLDIISNKEGLLEYTRSLLNATNGQFIDTTRKAFKKDGNVIGFQGSPLWEGNKSTYSSGSGNYGKKGVRNHTSLDPYGADTTDLAGTKGFAKSIRFKGNILYNGANSGNKDSVIYDTVLPRIHPVKKDDIIDNKNLMFSLENLAIGTVKREKFGVIDDEYGTPIPLSEVGNFGGRLMWFPPYNIDFNEVAHAKYNPTVMVGRNEPMYNYINSERSATLSFSLLIDYPEQLRNIDLVGENKNKAIADFFAYGGDPIPDEYHVEVVEKKIKKLKDSISEIEGLTEQAEVNVIVTKPVTIYFPNDMPNVNQLNSAINDMYNNPYHYEISKFIESANDGNGFGLNADIYYRTGITSTGDVSYINQYTAIETEDQFGVSQLNKNLVDVFTNEEYRKYYDINITGESSKLYLISGEEDYNIALGNRRAEAANNLVVAKLTAMFGASAVNDININVVESVGSANADPLGANPAYVHNGAVKKERNATIEIVRNSVPIDKKTQTINIQQELDVAQINKEIQVLEKEYKNAKSVITENIFNKRNKAILNSFESVSDNQFYSAFHSQTPEDFHRRLTFLQQCTRQGAAKRYDIVDENGVLRAKNSVFGKQPICILRVGDFYNTKVIIETVTIDYNDSTWDMNPEGFGMQPMMANVTLQMKLIGGQSLKGPIDALQNAVSFNYYANSTFSDKGVYARASEEANNQSLYTAGIMNTKNSSLNDAYDNLIEKTTEGDK